jgi:hypothetical protein
MNLFELAQTASNLSFLKDIVSNAAKAITDSSSTDAEIKDASKASTLAKKKIAADNKSKGGLSDTKKRIGANDYRKGGYVLSTVDNRKMKND